MIRLGGMKRAGPLALDHIPCIVSQWHVQYFQCGFLKKRSCIAS